MLNPWALAIVVPFWPCEGGRLAKTKTTWELNLFVYLLCQLEKESGNLWTVIELIVTLLVSLIFNDEFSWILEFEGAALSVLLDGFQVVCEQAQSWCWPSRSIPPFKFYVGLFLLFAILICFHSYDTALCGSILVSVAVQWQYSELQMTFQVCFSEQQWWCLWVFLGKF